MPWLDRSPQTKVVIVDLDDLIVGVIVDEVFDVFLLDPAKVSSIPTAIHSVKDEYLQGATVYREKMLGLLDLAQILTQGDLVVDEAV